MTQPHQPPEDLRERARAYVGNLPAETTLGNRGPRGDGHGEPADHDRQR